MIRPAARRTILMAAAGTAAAAAMAGAVNSTGAHGGADLRGTVAFASGAEIPKGRLVIHLQDQAGDTSAAARRAAPQMQLDTDGAAPQLAFTLTAPATVSATSEVVAELQRPEDGWLLARGSAEAKPGTPIEVILYPVMY